MAEPSRKSSIRRRRPDPDGWAWCAAFCKADQEAHAAGSLERKVPGSEAWLPRIGTERVIRGVVKTTWELAFPRYVLIRLPRLTDWHPASRAEGVVRLLGPGGAAPPFLIRDREMDRLMNEFGGRRAQVVHRLDRKRPLKVNELVRADVGPMAGFEGKVHEMRARQRVDVVIELFGRPTVATFHASELSSVDMRFAS